MGGKRKSVSHQREAPGASNGKVEKVTVARVARMKAKQTRITMLTAYDYTTARIVDGAGVDTILVGDSLGMVMLGYENTLPVTMDEMVHHTRAVTRAVKRAMVIADMPFMSYQASLPEALANAGRLIKEGRAEAIKLEGGAAVVDQVRAISAAGIPVMAHLGLTPQAIHQMSGYRVQGKSEDAAREMLAEALALEAAGAFSIVLECIPHTLARDITARLRIPTIGIGAGPDCDGQVLVLQDMLGLYQEIAPRHVKRYANLHEAATKAIGEFNEEVRSGAFPTMDQSFTMDAALAQRLHEEFVSE
ncbi:MAG: 3-methyl-2-oxobutanoate hydroxymethyltransferase [Armatimonadetes bacterium]|nr:3-methyl-2-oxobutanoate hydroxymethyltransferase [Armatimonadota bacterium]